MAVDSISPVFSTQQATALQQLTSGSRINQAADDPAGQAIVSAYTSQIREQDVAIRNANDGIGLLQTANGASSNIVDQIQRLSELSLQAQNGTLNDAQRNILNTEFQQGLESIQQIAGTTSFNGTNLLDGSYSSLSIALGESATDINLPDLTTSTLGLNGLSIDSTGNATTTLDQLNAALETINQGQAQFGAQQNTLVASINNIAETNLNTIATRSQIDDADMARAYSEQVRQQVLDNASVALQSQRNQQQENTLQLLSS